MTPVFVAGSRKFYKEVEELVKKLKGGVVKVASAGKWSKAEADDLKSEKAALLMAFKEIDNADIVYVYAGKGYVGRTVAMEIAYAYARNKVILSSEAIEEFSAHALISKIMKPEELLKFCLKK